MEKNRGIIRELLKFEFELGHSEKEAMDNINRAKGNGTVNRMTVWRWFSKFRNNQMDIADKKRSGRPREVDRVAVVNGQTPRKDFRNKKAMLCVWWDRRGVIFWELLEQGMTVNSNVYCEQLENTRRALRNRRIPVVFLDDNAKLHRSRQTLQKLEDMGWKHLEHPPYSPDLSPSDFYLFRSLEHWLRGKKVQNDRRNARIPHRILRFQRPRMVPPWNPQTWRTMAESDRIWWRILWLLVSCCFVHVFVYVFCNKNLFLILVTKLSCQPNKYFRRYKCYSSMILNFD